MSDASSATASSPFPGRIIEIEEHWWPEAIQSATEALPAELRDASLALNDHGDIPERLSDVGAGRVAAMDAAGIDTQILSVAPPGTNGLTPARAAALSAAANDQVATVVRSHPGRFAALSTLPWGDPDAAAAELERTTKLPGHVGVMAYGRCGDRHLDDAANAEVLATAARLRRPILLHPQIPSAAVRAALYEDLGNPLLELGLATFGWGWHIEAGAALLRLILTGAFDRHPDLQVVSGHWGEMVLFALDRADRLSNVASLERPVREYFSTNIHITASGMLAPRLLRHALEHTTVDRILLSGDYPFQPLDHTAIQTFLATLPDPADRERVAHANADSLFGLNTFPAASA